MIHAHIGMCMYGGRTSTCALAWLLVHAFPCCHFGLKVIKLSFLWVQLLRQPLLKSRTLTAERIRNACFAYGIKYLKHGSGAWCSTSSRRQASGLVCFLAYWGGAVAISDQHGSVTRVADGAIGPRTDFTKAHARCAC